MTELESEMLECTVEEYLCAEVEKAGGGTRKIQYIGLRGCADRLVTFPWNRIFLVELKRPKGGKISVHQDSDTKWLGGFGVMKLYLYTRRDVDVFLARVMRGVKQRTPHDVECDCYECIPL